MKRTALWILFLCLATSCEPTPPEPVATEAPLWVKEAQQRSRAAAEAAPAGDAPAQDQVVDKPLLWSVTSSSGAQSHLLGTYHVGTDFHGLPALPEPVRAAFEASTLVVLEADTGAPPADEVAKFVLLPGPRMLDSMLKPDQWDLLVEQSGMPPQQLERVRPHVAVSALIEKWTPDAGVRGMDGRFVILARAHDKRLAYLETPAQQMEMLAAHITLPMLVEMLDDVPGQRAKLEEMRTAFVAGDAATLERLAFDPEQMRAHPGFHEALFWQRNARWIPILEPMLQEGGAFVAVGAGHLVGPQSVVDLLQSKGYAVDRVEP